ncbi:MAG: prolyl oligopeptidase family serine peptidase [Bacteroidota bacterium]|jgi:predicted peptidase
MKSVLSIISIAGIMTMIGCSSSKEWIIPPGQHPQHFEKKIVTDVGYDLLVYTPKDFSDGNKRWPLIIFLHGSGERGNDVNKLKVHSLPKIVDTKDDFPFIVVSPQSHEGEQWHPEGLNAMLDEVIRQLPVDTNRIYLTGLSRGGLGVWKFAIAHPERFAAIAPVCGWGILEDVGNLKTMPTWVFHGAKDNVVSPTESEKMVEALKKSGNTEVKFTLYPDANHNAWDATYANQELYDWFLQHTRKEQQKGTEK